MADAKVTLKPSDQIVKAANDIEYVEAGDKKIGLKKPGILAQFDIVEVLGDAAQNTSYMQMVLPILWVVEIDGDIEPMPTSKRELRSLIQRLGEEGVAAIMSHLVAKATQSDEGRSTKN